MDTSKYTITETPTITPKNYTVDGKTITMPMPHMLGMQLRKYRLDLYRGSNTYGLFNYPELNLVTSKGIKHFTNPKTTHTAILYHCGDVVLRLVE